MKKLPSIFFKENRNKVFEKLPPNSLAIVISSDEMPRNGDQNYRFRQSSDLFYLTGIEQEKTILVLNPSHPDIKKRELLFIRYASELEQIWEGYKLSKQEASEISGIENIKYTTEFESTIGDLFYYAEEVFLCNNENSKFQRYFNDAEYRFYEHLKYRFPLHTYKRLSPVLINQRLIKSEYEIDIIQHSIDITEKAFRRVLKYTKPDVTEFEIEAEITHEFIRNQAYSHSYLPIVAAGADNNILHYNKNNKICKAGELVLLDFGAEYCNYAADLSRTIPVSGKFDKFQKKVYNSVLNVQKEAKKLIRPGLTINVWNFEVGKIMQEELLKLELLKKEDIQNQGTENQAYKKYFLHGTGHFMGLDVHDVGTNDTIWKPGMVLTVEPGIYVREKNFGIRLENDVIITEKGCNDLMNKIPIEAVEIEELMN